MTFRTKLLLAQAPFVAALILLGLVATRSVAHLGENTGLILKDNHRSILAAQRIKALVEQLDRNAMALALDRPVEPDVTAAVRQQLESELRLQESNLTELGEPEATLRLRDAWTHYQGALIRLERASPGQREPLYFAEVFPVLEAVDRYAQEILEINETVMVAKSDRAQRLARRTNMLVVLVTLAVLIVGIAIAAMLTVRLSRPLSILSRSVRRLGEGDLEVRARVEGNSEIAALAREFNTMADKLCQYQRSSLGGLLQAQQASQAAIDSLPDSVVVLGVGGEVVSANRAAEDLLRVSLESVGNPLERVDSGVREVLERVRAHVAEGRGAYVPRGFDEVVRTPSSEGDRFLLPRATPLYAAQGLVTGITVVLQDVTRLMRFEELNNDRVATMAHELRTPLTSMRMAVHLLAEEVVGPLTTRQADLVFAARQDCERLQSMVDDLLDLSSAEGGRTKR